MKTQDSQALRTPLTGYVLALASVAGVTLVIAVIDCEVRIANISMLYLVAVIATGVALGAGPAIVASLASFLAFDFFFVHPRYTFTVTEPSEWLALLLFLLTAVITGQLAARQRLRANEAEQREHEAALLYDIARLMNDRDADAALRAVSERLLVELRLVAVGVELDTRGVGSHSVVEVGSPEALRVVRSSALAPFRLLREGVAATAEHRGEAGRWVRGVPSRVALQSRPSEYRPEIVPIRSGEARAGSLVVVHSPYATSDAAGERVLAAVAAQIGSTLERERLRREATESEALRRTDELKTALLNAVSHDLRSPLASIVAAAGSLQQTEVPWTEAEREGFAESIEQEALRLDRLVGHLLDMSRIESGSLRPAKDWYDLPALIDEVLGRMQPRLANRPTRVEVDDELPPVPLDYVEIDVVLTNLIENATKYTPPGSEICISVSRAGSNVEVSVVDSGPGIAPEALSRIFEPFYRANDSGVRGTGLGLAVARGLVEAHGGTLSAQNRPEGGTAFRFALPLTDAAESEVGVS